MNEGRRTPPPDEVVEKARYDHKTGERRVVVEDEAWRERLEYLRRKSNKLNKLLQQKLEEANLPYYSWNKSSAGKKRKPVEYPKIMRLAILLRPEFYQSSEDKTNETRFNTGDEQLSIFFHVRPDNTIQTVRYKFGFTQAAYGLYFASSAAPDLESQGTEEERALVEGYIAKETMEELADYMIRRLKPAEGEAQGFAQRSSEIFKKAYEISSLQDAQQYFSNKEAMIYQPKEFIRNLGKVVIMSVLEKTLLAQIEGKRGGIEEVLRDKAGKLLNVEVAKYNPGRLGSFIPNAEMYVDETITRLMKAYKSRILGWEK